MKIKPPKPKAVECPDKKGTCPDGSTCCLLNSGKYGCCPLPKAVCCKDHIHCCPHGTTCNVQQSSCDKGGVSVPWSVKTPAMEVRKYTYC